ncbi:ubiquitin-like small modifier protein 1 [Candidatus Hodarchaeum mangrovi]
MAFSDDPRRIQVKARFFGQFKYITKKREILISLTLNTTVNLLLNALIDQFPELNQQLFDDQLNLHSWIIILINGHNINIYDGLNTSLNNGDIISIFPPVAGGLYG